MFDGRRPTSGTTALCCRMLLIHASSFLKLDLLHPDMIRQPFSFSATLNQDLH
ncbi:hypothetical protein M758_6G200900 [Ceratodon purpureus]|uniref:Uncharacterized protein n=1 Tax=Ceratodon purpureus TaxID=3225 RepID=A0A8T0HJX7_CERPU|nr:hypothetical protein KC19_6G209300 [Ceratodon purpureus]KAG0614747.1 hypothetical protein M758_6G200900 [Ceratodon purpureus]